MTRFTKKQAQAARTLAGAYASFMTATTDNAHIVWSGVLLDSQRETGVELVSEILLNYWIRQGNK